MKESNTLKHSNYLYKKWGQKPPLYNRFIQSNYLKGNFTTCAFTKVFLISINISVPILACSVAT